MASRHSSRPGAAHIDFEMDPTAERLFSDRVDTLKMKPFLDSFAAYRLD